MNTRSQLNSYFSWYSFSNCLLMCTVLTCTLPLESLHSSSSLEAHTAKCSLHGNWGSEWKGKEGRKGASKLSWGTESCSGCMSEVIHHLKHHSLSVKSQAGELVANLWYFKQGKEKTDCSESRFATILSWWLPLILKRLICTSYIFSVKHLKMRVCKQLAHNNISLWGIFSDWRKKSFLVWLT